MTIARTEYPRPDFVRDSFQCLNGTWKFAFDDADLGRKEKWYKENCFEKNIEVPFAYQAKLSGIGDTRFHDILWYLIFFSNNLSMYSFSFINLVLNNFRYKGP